MDLFLKLSRCHFIMVDQRSCMLIQVVFYCHFPDLLLAKHTTILRRLYRKPIDLIEELTTGLISDISFYIVQFLCRFNITLIIHTLQYLHLPLSVITGMANLILVNSKFTASTFANTFKHLNARGIRPAVLYPAVNVDQFDGPHSSK